MFDCFRFKDTKKGTMERLKDILSNLGPAGDRVEVLEGIKPALSALSRKDMEVPVVSSNIFLP